MKRGSKIFRGEQPNWHRVSNDYLKKRYRRNSALPPLKREEKEETIQYYKIVKGLNKVEYVAPNRAAPALNSTEPVTNIRGHSHRLERQAVKDCAQRELFFSNRCITRN